MKIYGTREAAEYLGFKLETLKYHLYVIRDLEPDDRIGDDDRLVFTKENLDAFSERKRPPGRPRTDSSEAPTQQ